MSTTKETIAHIVDTLNREGSGGGEAATFTARAMFGEYGLYYKGTIVGLVCDNTLFIKKVPASAALASVCEEGSPYPGSKPYYVVEESGVGRVESLAEICADIAKAAQPKKVTHTK